MVQNKDNKPSGCLSLFIPVLGEYKFITSWTGKWTKWSISRLDETGASPASYNPNVASRGPNRFKAEKYHPVIRLGGYCTEFITELEKTLPELMDELDVLSDFHGNYQGLLFYRQCPKRLENIQLEVMALETEQKVFIDFAEARAEFTNQAEALQMLKAIMSDEIVHVARFINRRLESCTLASVEEAGKLVEENRYVSRGCLDYLLPAKMVKISVHSWSGSQDMRSSSD